MDHASLVGVGQGAEHLRDVVKRFRQLDRPLLQSVVERVPFHQLHEHEELVFKAVRVIERRDVDVRKARLDLDLADEALGQIRGVAQVRQQDLHGLGAIGNRMADAVHASHASAADQIDNLILADDLAWLHYFGFPPAISCSISLSRNRSNNDSMLELGSNSRSFKASAALRNWRMYSLPFLRTDSGRPSTASSACGILSFKNRSIDADSLPRSSTALVPFAAAKAWFWRRRAPRSVWILAITRRQSSSWAFGGSAGF